MFSRSKLFLPLLVLCFCAPSWSDPVAVTKYVGTWSPSGKYLAGQLVSYDNKSWLAIKKNTDSQPGQSPDSWVTLGSNVQGPKGDTGPQGPQGIQGFIGPIGDTGPQGAQGIQGVAGPIGPQGIPGIDGATGPQGPSGPSGARGPQGAQGPAGAGGGVKVFDANGQYLGLYLDFDRYTGEYRVLVPSLGKVADLIQPMDSNGLIPPDQLNLGGEDFSDYFRTNNNGHDYTVRLHYTTTNCTGSPYFTIENSDRATNWLGTNGSQYGYLSISSIVSLAQIKSVKQLTAQCSPGPSFIQAAPPTIDECRTNFTAAYNYSSPWVGDACTNNGLTSPCYQCVSYTPVRVYGYQASYTFNPVTLPFSLPIALPLRYVAP